MGTLRIRYCDACHCRKSSRRSMTVYSYQVFSCQVSITQGEMLQADFLHSSCDRFNCLVFTRRLFRSTVGVAYCLLWPRSIKVVLGSHQRHAWIDTAEKICIHRESVNLSIYSSPIVEDASKIDRKGICRQLPACRSCFKHGLLQWVNILQHARWRLSKKHVRFLRCGQQTTHSDIIYLDTSHSVRQGWQCMARHFTPQITL